MIILYIVKKKLAFSYFNILTDEISEQNNQ